MIMLNKYLIIRQHFSYHLDLYLSIEMYYKVLGDSFIPMMAGVFELIARAIVAFTLPKVIGFTGICLSDPLAWIAASVPLMITYYRKMKKIEIENQEKGMAL